jgi:guanylate kinase
VIKRRLRDAMLQIEACGEFRYLVINGDLSSAHDHFQAVIVAELCKAERRPGLVARMTRVNR